MRARPHTLSLHGRGSITRSDDLKVNALPLCLVPLNGFSLFSLFCSIIFACQLFFRGYFLTMS